MKARVSARFDETIHAPLRLRICVLLSPVESMSFAALREELDIAESVLSKHLKTLVAAEYVALTKTSDGARRATWARLTRAGRRALQGHLLALQELAAAADPGGEPAMAAQESAVPATMDA